MIEAILAWLCLFIGIVTKNANYFIASGVFAVAAQIELYRKKGGR